MIKLPKSQISRIPQFEVQVAAYSHELRHWFAHMASVKADATNPNVAADMKHAPFPRPTAPHRFIQDAVNESGDADYEIVDDAPPAPSPEAILRAKKDALLAKIDDAEREAMSVVHPPAKHRITNLMVADVRKADEVRATEATKIYESICREADDLQKVANNDLVVENINKAIDELPEVYWADGRIKPAAGKPKMTQQQQKRLNELRTAIDDFRSGRTDPCSGRSADEAAVMGRYEDLQKKLTDITRRAAKAQSDVEDLTVETIDSFEIPSLTD